MSNVAGSLAILVSADTASAESSLSKVAALAERESKRMERAQAAAKQEGDRFIAMLQKQVDTFGLTGTKMLAYEASLKGVSKEAEPLIAKLNELKDAQERVRKSAAGAGFDEARKGAEEARGATAGFTRELLVLAHELSQGQFKRFGGSLLVLAEYSGAATRALSALVGPLGLAAAGSGVMALAIYKGYEESEALRKSLVLTGNFAGITEGRFNSLAKELSGSTHIGIGKTRDALQALVNSGDIGPRVLGPLAQAATLYAKATGETEEAVAKDFAKMGDGVAKFAAEHNKQLNFLSASQYDYIKRLEEQGKKEEAELVVAKAISDHLANVMKPNLGYLERAIKSAGEGWDHFWDSAKGLGRAETAQDHLAKLNKELHDLEFGPRGSHRDRSESLGRGRTVGDAQNSKRAEIADFQKMTAAQEQLTAARARDAEIQKKGRAAADRLKQLSDELGGVDRLKRDLEALHRDFDDRRQAAGGGAAGLAAFPKAEEDRMERLLRLRDRSKEDRAADADAKKVADLVRRTSEEYAKETAVLKDQQEQYDRFNKVVDKSAAVKLEEMLRTEEGRKIKLKDVETLRQQAAAEDVQAQATKRAADAAAERKKEDEQRVAAQKSLDDFMAKAQINADAEIDRIRETTKELGLNTLELKQYNAERAIQKALDIELSKSKVAGLDTTDASNGAARQIENIKKTIATEDAAQKQFGFGASKVFKQYQEDAANAAKYAEGFLGGSIKQAEDALLSFEKTGKLSFGNLFSFMAEEYLKQINRMIVASVLPGAPGGSFGGGFGSISDIVDGIGMIFGGLMHSLAVGTNYVPYDGMPDILHKGEAVVPAAYNPANGGAANDAGNAMHFDFSGQVLNVGAGVSRGEFASALKANNDQLMANLLRLRGQGALA